MKVFTPREHQKVLIAHALTHPRVMQSSFMGSGKTSATASWVDYMHRFGLATGRGLVLAPKRVATDVWPDEFAQWSHLSTYPVTPVVGTLKQRIKALSSDSKIYTINYESIPWLLEYLGGKWPFEFVIADESTKLKSFRLGGNKSQRARVLSKVAFKSKYWHNLTGTICPNGLQDLWGQMYFIDRGQRLGATFGAFRERWFRQIEIKNESVRYEMWKPFGCAETEITAAISDLCCSIRAEDYFPVDKPLVNDINVSLPSNVRKHYDFLEKEGVYDSRVFANADSMLHQLVQGATYDEGNKTFTEVHDVKIQALESLVNELNGANLIVVYRFKHDLTRLKKAFSKGVDVDDRQNISRDWNSGSIPVLFMQVDGAVHGLNFQHGGHHICFFSNTFNYESYAQVIERIGPVRQMQSGYKRIVYVYRIVCEHTVDEAMIFACENKCGTQEAVNYYLSRGRK